MALSFINQIRQLKEEQEHQEDQEHQDTGNKKWECPRTSVLFTGKPEELRTFLHHLSMLFRIENIKSEDKKLKILLNSLAGPAVVWADLHLQRREEDIENKPITFKQAVEALIQNYEQPVDFLMVIRKMRHTFQQRSVQEYNTQFSEVLRNYKMQRNVEEDLAIDLYLGGLKEDLAIAVFQEDPKICAEAMKLGVAADRMSFIAKKRSHETFKENNRNYQKSSYKKYKNLAKSKGQRLNSREINPLLTKNNQCFYCNKVGHYGKDCRSKKAMLTK
ncbi:hypothetical protein ZYGR_0H02960 [Zygosaccharomyces rouxii]|uniref:CCHC-type domain-containing protein n=1 Tax=Zygosaccharomyces rouxii TaxID=4956 RepID=A0A1Q2ZVY3_ZYGRO|nr:hypothetical protein ZYGR_0H02960 [Zygosaccharomyces rouxii]